MADTNVFLEVLLNQERADEAKRLLSMAGEHSSYMSDFSLHSIGLLLFRQNRHVVSRQFLGDVALNGAATLISLALADLEGVGEGRRHGFNSISTTRTTIHSRTTAS